MKKVILLCTALISTCILISTAAACTDPLTQGYWKTHSKYGPASYDDAWGRLYGLGEDTPFFDSGKTYYEVLTTPPVDGNAFYILAHQWITAKLNMINGAKMLGDPCDPTTVMGANLGAYNLLETYAGDMSIPAGEDREHAIEYATILDNFNSGVGLM